MFFKFFILHKRKINEIKWNITFIPITLGHETSNSESVDLISNAQLKVQKPHMAVRHSI